MPSGLHTSNLFSSSKEQSQQSSQDQRVQLVPYRQMYRHSNHVSSPYSVEVEVQLSNFYGETGDDSAAGLKSSSFNEDISASLLLLVRIIILVVPTEFWLMPLPLSLQFQFQSQEWDSIGPSHRRHSKKRALHRSRTSFNLIQGSTLEYSTTRAECFRGRPGVALCRANKESVCKKRHIWRERN